MARPADGTSAVVTRANRTEAHEAEGTGNVLERIATGIETQNYLLHQLLNVCQDFVNKSGES